MTEKQVPLDCAAFLDSEVAARLSNVPSGGAKKIVETFLSCAYVDHGTAPRLCDGHDIHAIVGHLMPPRFKKKDPLAAHVHEVLSAYFDFLEETAVTSQAYEIRRALDSTIDEFTESVRTGELVHHHGHHVKQKPVVHKAEKTGRNDPCVCGSGRKFKKCCGKGA